MKEMQQMMCRAKHCHGKCDRCLVVLIGLFVLTYDVAISEDISRVGKRSVNVEQHCCANHQLYYDYYLIW